MTTYYKLLLEDGDDLLLEDGGSLRIEEEEPAYPAVVKCIQTTEGPGDGRTPTKG